MRVNAREEGEGNAAKWSFPWLLMAAACGFSARKKGWKGEDGVRALGCRSDGADEKKREGGAWVSVGRRILIRRWRERVRAGQMGCARVRGVGPEVFGPNTI